VSFPVFVPTGSVLLDTQSPLADIEDSDIYADIVLSSSGTSAGESTAAAFGSSLAISSGTSAGEASAAAVNPIDYIGSFFGGFYGFVPIVAEVIDDVEPVQLSVQPGDAEYIDHVDLAIDRLCEQFRTKVTA
jgi:hypothetical protein